MNGRNRQKRGGGSCRLYHVVRRALEDLISCSVAAEMWLLMEIISGRAAAPSCFGGVEVVTRHSKEFRFRYEVRLLFRSYLFRRGWCAATSGLGGPAPALSNAQPTRCRSSRTHRSRASYRRSARSRVCSPPKVGGACIRRSTRLVGRGGHGPHVSESWLACGIVRWIVAHALRPNTASIGGLVITNQNREGGPSQRVHGQKILLVQIQFYRDVQLTLRGFRLRYGHSGIARARWGTVKDKGPFRPPS